MLTREQVEEIAARSKKERETLRELNEAMRKLLESQEERTGAADGDSGEDEKGSMKLMTETSVNMSEAKGALSKLRKVVEADDKAFKDLDAELAKIAGFIDLSSHGKKAREEQERNKTKELHEGLCKDAVSALESFATAIDVPMAVADPTVTSTLHIVETLGDSIETGMLRELAENLKGRQRDLKLLHAVAVKSGCSERKADAAVDEFMLPDGYVMELAAEIGDARRRCRPMGSKVLQLVELAEKAHADRDPEPLNLSVRSSTMFF